MEKPTRKYKFKDIEMLLGIGIIIENAIADKEFLQSKRATWTDEFFENFKTRIDTVVATHLGADNAKQLREATQKVLEITVPARLDLAEIKTQIEEDFKKDKTKRDEILNTLGFSAFNAVAQRDQEALIELLYKFETNLTSELKAELVAKGIAEETLTNAVSHSLKLKNANIAQEVKKAQRMVLTHQAIEDLNDIYDDGIAIAAISAKFHKGNTAKQQQFVFSKVVRNMNRSPITQ